MRAILAMLAAGLAAGFIAPSHAKLACVAGEERCREEGRGDKAAAGKARKPTSWRRRRTGVVANYKKRHPASMSGKKK